MSNEIKTQIKLCIRSGIKSIFRIEIKKNTEIMHLNKSPFISSNSLST